MFKFLKKKPNYRELHEELQNDLDKIVNEFIFKDSETWRHYRNVDYGFWISARFSYEDSRPIKRYAKFHVMFLNYLKESGQLEEYLEDQRNNPRPEV